MPIEVLPDGLSRDEIELLDALVRKMSFRDVQGTRKKMKRTLAMRNQNHNLVLNGIYRYPGFYHERSMFCKVLRLPDGGRHTAWVMREDGVRKHVPAGRLQSLTKSDKLMVPWETKYIGSGDGFGIGMRARK